MAKRKSKEEVAAEDALGILVAQAAKGKTADVTYYSEKDKEVIQRTVGAVSIDGNKVYVQDQTNPDANVKSFLIENLVSANPNDEDFEDSGHNEFKGDTAEEVAAPEAVIEPPPPNEEV